MEYGAGRLTVAEYPRLLLCAQGHRVLASWAADHLLHPLLPVKRCIPLSQPCRPAADALTQAVSTLTTLPADASAADAIAMLTHLNETVRPLVDAAEVALLDAALDRGWSWDQIGDAYGGRTRQTMQQLYRRRGGRGIRRAGRSPGRDAVMLAMRDGAKTVTEIVATTGLNAVLVNDLIDRMEHTRPAPIRSSTIRGRRTFELTETGATVAARSAR